MTAKVSRWRIHESHYEKDLLRLGTLHRERTFLELNGRKTVRVRQLYFMAVRTIGHQSGVGYANTSRVWNTGMPRHWPKHPRQPVVAAVVIQGDGERLARRDDATLCLSCGHVRRVQAPPHIITRMRHCGAICRDCPPITNPDHQEPTR